MLDKIKLLENKVTDAKNDLRLAVLDYIKPLAGLAEKEGLTKTIVFIRSDYFKNKEINRCLELVLVALGLDLLNKL